MILRCPVGAGGRGRTGEEATAGREDGFVIPNFPFEILAQTESEGRGTEFRPDSRSPKSFGKK